MLLGAVILGVGLIVAFLLIGQWFVNASPAQIAKALKRAGVVVLLLVIIVLAATGRLGWAMAALAGMAPWAGRIFRLLMMGQLMRRMGLFGGPSGFHTPGSGSGGFGFGMPGGGGRQTGPGTSEVATDHLRMTLHHASGQMSGEVLTGPFAGRQLDDLDPVERLDLWRQVRGDPDSARVYETWLDRHDPDWRDRAEGAGDRAGGSQGAAGSADGAMTRAEALRILELEEGATADEIKRAYRRVMASAHPDHGGSSWMAAKVNEAKRVLLGG
ncbi:DnaJ domain-containing protein [Caenispirillum salinarum]|uniref:DnaJ domain-containing protein n=1 Tax=Caenispirillum salinarum TaxID=859058 RepID=UPI00384AC7CC